VAKSEESTVPCTQVMCSESRNTSSVIQENYLILNHVRLGEVTKQDYVFITNGWKHSAKEAHFQVFSSHNDGMRTGAAVVVQSGKFVIAGGCGPLEDLIRCGFANELLAGEPKNFTHVGIGFGA
jgi:hypothetical protein